MTDLDDIGLKIKGKLQQAKGQIKKDSGDEAGGTVDKIKGKINETIADIKLND